MTQSDKLKMCFRARNIQPPKQNCSNPILSGTTIRALFRPPSLPCQRFLHHLQLEDPTHKLNQLCLARRHHRRHHYTLLKFLGNVRRMDRKSKVLQARSKRGCSTGLVCTREVKSGVSKRFELGSADSWEKGGEGMSRNGSRVGMLLDVSCVFGVVSIYKLTL